MESGRRALSDLSPLGTLIAEIRNKQRLRRSVKPSTVPAVALATLGSEAPAASRQPLTSPFASLIDDARDENRLRRKAQAKDPVPKPATSRPRGREPELHLETRAVSDPPTAFRNRTCLLLPISLALHAVLLLALVVTPLLMPEALPSPAAGAKVFFVAPLAPPQTPAAPAPRSAAALRRPAQPDRTSVFTAPAETPQQTIPEEAVDMGVPGGGPGGVEGGVPGGVTGAVVEGLPERSEPLQPIRVGGQIKEPRKLKHVEPVYPEIAARANVHGTIILEISLSAQGRVTEAKVLRGVPLLDAAAIAAVKQWLYAPTLLDGVPVPVTMTITVRFALE